jgi:hypothetical protein
MGSLFSGADESLFWSDQTLSGAQIDGRHVDVPLGFLPIEE